MSKTIPLMRLWWAFIAIGALVVALAVGLPALTARGADHLDAPGLTSPGGDGRLDIADVYAFRSPTTQTNAVLIMTVNPLAGVLSPTTFHPKAKYEFLIDTNGNAKEDKKIKIEFSKPDKDGVQKVKVKGPGGIKGKGKTGEDIDLKNGGVLRADLFDDPFFFDLPAFLAVDFCSGGSGSDFFASRKISAIVLEVPSSSLGPDDIGVWARTHFKGRVDRMGRPAINTVFIPNNPFEPVSSEPSQKNAFNTGKPKNDQRDFRAEIVDTLTFLFTLNDGAGDDTSDDAAAIQGLADFLLPDILTIDTSSSAGFPNGRQLADDVIDAELGLITEGLITTDCVDANDVAFLGAFPYLAP
ncbi:MAG: DUF4331 family protein [Chloroflexi bacterium]|nr:DUF4331 family protein [Chloroflexota bacterium]